MNIWVTTQNVAEHYNWRYLRSYTILSVWIKTSWCCSPLLHICSAISERSYLNIVINRRWLITSITIQIAISCALNWWTTPTYTFWWIGLKLMNVYSRLVMGSSVYKMSNIWLQLRLIAFQITSNSTVGSIVYSYQHLRKEEISALLALREGNRRCHSQRASNADILFVLQRHHVLHFFFGS